MQNTAQYSTKSKGSRIYFLIFAVIYFALLLGSAVSLGSFGVAQQKLKTYLHNKYSLGPRCILFVHHDNAPPPIGACGYTLWGQVSILIVAFVWLVYSIVLFFVAPRM
jgi:hypothetical protein